MPPTGHERNNNDDDCGSSTSSHHRHTRQAMTPTAACKDALPPQSSSSASRGNSRRRTNTSSSVASSATSTTSTDRHYRSTSISTAVPQSLQLSDQQLVKSAQLASSSIDWDGLRDASAQWDTKKTTSSRDNCLSGGFRIATRQDGDVHHIMARGSVTCSVAELQHALWATSTRRYCKMMSELHGASFLAGAVVHQLDAFTVKAAAAASSTRSTSSSASYRPIRTPPVDFDVSVKTATFARPHAFARDEHWCFLDHLQTLSDGRAFAITMHSMRAEDVLPAAPTSNNNNNISNNNNINTVLSAQHKNQLQEMTAGYNVATDVRGQFVNVAFYARFLDANHNTSSNFQPNATAQTAQTALLRASKSTTKARLLKMASATCSLPAVVQRRRFGAQSFIDPAILARLPANAHCTCCTAAFSLFNVKKRCDLCGYRVCIKCIRKHDVERSHRSSGNPTSINGASRPTVRVCTTCTRRVNAANYDDLPLGVASPLAIHCDASLSPTKNPPASATNQSLVEFLRRSFENATDAPRKRALVQVARTLLATDDVGVSPSPASSSSMRARSTTTHSVSSNHSCRSDRTDSTSDRIDSVDAATFATLARDLHVQQIPLKDCVVAHADARAYPIAYRTCATAIAAAAAADGSNNENVNAAQDDDDAVTHYPIPVNEQSRIDFVAQQELTTMINVPELEIICAIASKEMGCAAGLVTIIADDKIHIVASNDVGYANLVVPRAESICSHMVMSDKPLLLPHPQADIRFNKMPPVLHAGVRFYCGFPLIGPDNAVYGSVCCVDSKTHDVTQSQYSIMTKLAATAARIMEMRAPKA